MMYRITTLPLIGVLVAASTVFALYVYHNTAIVEAQSAATSTVSVLLEKKFSGTQEGYAEDDFSYHVSGNGINVTVAHGDSIDLPIGTYTIEELVPDGFVKDDWRIGWYGSCEAGDEFSTTLVIDEGNVDHGTLTCEADNQYRPENNDDDVASTTVALVLEKKFSGPQEGFTVDQFSFRVTGSSTDTTVAHGGSVDLTQGTYVIEEIGPQDFDFDDWRIQWSGACEDNDDNNSDATIVIDTGNIDDGTLDCRADNQYRPDGDGGGNGGDDDETATSTLTVVKVVSGTSTPPETFSFTVTGGATTSATTSISETFEPDGDNEFTLATGTYSVVETGTSTGFTVSYDNCTDILLEAGESATCTITNTYDDDDDGGGGNGGDDDDDDDNGGGGSNNDDDDDDDGSSSSSGRSRSGSGSNNDNDSDNPGGLVAGEQTSVIPRGAANAGGGGTAPAASFWEKVTEFMNRLF